MSENVEPSVALSFADDKLDKDLAGMRVTYTIHSDRCWGWICHERTIDEMHITKSSQLTLGAVVEIAMRNPNSSAVITLSPEAYDKLLGE